MRMNHVGRKMRRSALMFAVTAGLLPAVAQDAPLPPITVQVRGQAQQISAPSLIAGSCQGPWPNATPTTQRSVLELSIVVRPDGSLVSARVQRRSHDLEHDRAVIEWLQGCRFTPGTYAGVPVANVGQIEHVVHPGPPEAAAARPAIANPAGCAPRGEDYPAEARRRNETGNTKLNFTVDADGRLEKAAVVQSSGHERLDEVALRKLSECVFRPGRDAQGRPVGGSFAVEHRWVLQ